MSTFYPKSRKIERIFYILSRPIFEVLRLAGKPFWHWRLKPLATFFKITQEANNFGAALAATGGLTPP
jgi:hypothetical protein